MRFRHFTIPYFCDIIYTEGKRNPGKQNMKEVIKMTELRSAYTKEEIIEATRLLLQIRDDCVKINTDLLRKEKYKALNIAIDVLQYKWNTSEDDIIFSDM